MTTVNFITGYDGVSVGKNNSKTEAFGLTISIRVHLLLQRVTFNDIYGYFTLNGKITLAIFTLIPYFRNYENTYYNTYRVLGDLSGRFLRRRRRLNI